MKVYLNHYTVGGKSVTYPVTVEDSDCPLDSLIQEILADPFLLLDYSPCDENPSLTISSANGYILATVYLCSNLISFKPLFFYLPRCSTRMKAVKKWCVCNCGRIEKICSNKWEAKKLLSDWNRNYGGTLTIEQLRFYQ